MKHYLVLVDFTDIADIAVKQAIDLAKEKNAKISVCHIYNTKQDGHTEVLESQLNGYKSKIEAEGIACDIKISHGDLFSASEILVNELEPSMVIVGTHGKKGISQALFGSAIYKMVRSLKCPTLVVNERTQIRSGGFDKILVPVSHHDNFMDKVTNGMNLLSKTGTLYLFAVVSENGALDEKIQENVDRAKSYLNDHDISWLYKEESKGMANFGFADDTLKFMNQEEIGLISIIADIATESKHFGKMDKEKLLLNAQGLPVLCSN